MTVLAFCLSAYSLLMTLAFFVERGKRLELELDVETLEAEMGRALAPDDDEAETLPPGAA